MEEWIYVCVCVCLIWSMTRWSCVWKCSPGLPKASTLIGYNRGQPSFWHVEPNRNVCLCANQQTNCVAAFPTWCWTHSGYAEQHFRNTLISFKKISIWYPFNLCLVCCTEAREVIQVYADDYMKSLVEQANLLFIVTGKVQETGQIATAMLTVAMRKPKLTVKVGQPFPSDSPIQSFHFGQLLFLIQYISLFSLSPSCSVVSSLTIIPRLLLYLRLIHWFC